MWTQFTVVVSCCFQNIGRVRKACRPNNPPSAKFCPAQFELQAVDKFKFKHTRINAGSYSFNCSCSCQGQVSKQCVNTPFVPFQCLRRTKGSLQARGNCEYFVAWHFLRWRFVSTSPNTQDVVPPLVGCQRLLIQYIHSYRPYRMSFSIRNLQTRHAVMTGTYWYWVWTISVQKYILISDGCGGVHKGSISHTPTFPTRNLRNAVLPHYAVMTHSNPRAGRGISILTTNSCKI